MPIFAAQRPVFRPCYVEEGAGYTDVEFPFQKR